MTEPTGFITVDGEPMAYWLPDGLTAESIRIGEVKSGREKLNPDVADRMDALMRETAA